MHYQFSSNAEQLKIEDNLTRLAESRKLICTKLEQIDRLIKEVQQEYKQHSEHTLSISKAVCDYNASIDQEELRKEIDYKFWSIALDISQVEKFISSKEKSDMKEKLYDEPPVFEEEQAKKFIYGVMNSTEALASNLIKKIYSEIANVRFYSGNKYNSPLQQKNKNKIQKSFRMSMFSRYGLPSYVMHNDKEVALLQDLERVCYLVDGKLQPSTNNNIVAKLEASLRTNELTVEGDYFNITLFKNGNAKIDFLDDELVKRINLWGSRNHELPDFSGIFKKGKTS